MSRLRTTWFAGLGSVLLLVLTVSGVLGAQGERTGTPGVPFGRSVAAFVHAWLLEQEQEQTDEQTDEDSDEDLDEDETDEDEADEDEADEDETDELVEDGSHGACVSAVARGEMVLEGEFGNHGAMVSWAARVSCWLDTAPESGEDGTDEDGTDDGNDDELDEEGSTELAPTRSERTGGPPAWVLERKSGESAGSAKGSERTGGKAHGKGAEKGKAWGRQR